MDGIDPVNPRSSPQMEPEPEVEGVIEDDIPHYPLRTILDHSLYPRWTMGTGDVQDCHTVQRGMVYVAVCVQDFIYVGYVTASGNVASRISMHMSNAGSRLTREYPISYVQWAHLAPLESCWPRRGLHDAPLQTQNHR